MIIIAVYDSNRTGGAHDNDENRLTSLEQFRSMFLDMTYPVGAIYMSVNATSPATLFGGSWEAIQGRFLIGTNSTYTPGSTGGEATHVLTVSEMPSHRHDIGVNVAMINNTAAFTINDSSFDGIAGADNFNDTINAKGLTQAQKNRINANTGGGAAHNNMPPYLAVYMWKRTA